MEFRPSPHETGFRFGLIWSALGCAMTFTALVGCSYLIPEDPRPPRYNKLVPTDRRPPPLNSQSGAGIYGAPPAMATAPVITPENYDTVPQMNYNAPVPGAPAGSPPPPPANTSFVQQLPPQSPPVSSAPQPVSQPSWFERNFNWLPGVGEEPEDFSRTPMGRPLAPGAQATPPQAAPFGAGEPETARALAFSAPSPQGALAPIPPNAVNTSGAYQAASSSYPVLQDTPPAPTDAAESQARLERARMALQADQVNANDQRNAIAAQASSEPTLATQYGYPAPAAPAAPPPSAPALPPPPVPADAAGMTVPSFDGTPVAATPLNPITEAPPPAPQEPIVLRPPSSAEAAQGNAAGEPKVIQMRGSTGYLPDSRYVRKREE